MKRKRIATIAVVLISVIGLFLLLYPGMSAYINSATQSRAIAAYLEDIANLDPDMCDQCISEAMEYNKSLAGRVRQYHLDSNQADKYPDMLKTSESEVMGYLEIPRLNCFLPIYRWSDENDLTVAAGHVEWSSLPIGGTSSHCVIAGHRGIPSSNFFTDLDQMEVGDTFFIRVLDMTLTYEVEQVLIVEPDESSALTIEPDKDICTLTVCTPYGFHPHRVLARGVRLENAEEVSTIRVTPDNIRIEPLCVVSFVALILLTLLFALSTKKKQRQENTESK